MCAHTYTQWNDNSIICKNTDGTGDDYVKQNKPGTERQAPHDLTLPQGHTCVTAGMRNFPTTADSKRISLVEIESRMVITRGWEGVGEGEMERG